MPKKGKGHGTISGDLEKVLSGKAIPEGCELVNVEATVGTGDDSKKGCTLRFVVPKYGNAEGLRNFVSFYSEQVEEKNGTGVEFATGAIRSAMRAGVARLGDPKKLDDAAAILPPPSDIRTIDTAEVAGNRLTEWLRENPGQVPSQKILKDLGIA